MHVFTYGTLMFPDVWRAVVGREFATVAATAAGFDIYCVRDAVYPGIVAVPDSSVSGIVYLDVDPASIARLDAFEDDFYHRQTIEVHGDDGSIVTADAYVVPSADRHLLTNEHWAAEKFAARGDLARFVARYAGFERLTDDRG
jgi:gamma-glutamylcyclotransferase (GGCT)/AIG2-like uncharacterized protein YtfP